MKRIKNMNKHLFDSIVWFIGSLLCFFVPLFGGYAYHVQDHICFDCAMFGVYTGYIVFFFLMAVSSLIFYFMSRKSSARADEK